MNILKTCSKHDEWCFMWYSDVFGEKDITLWHMDKERYVLKLNCEYHLLTWLYIHKKYQYLFTNTFFVLGSYWFGSEGWALREARRDLWTIAFSLLPVHEFWSIWMLQPSKQGAYSDSRRRFKDRFASKQWWW